MTNQQYLIKRVDEFFRAMTVNGICDNIAGGDDAFHPDVMNELFDEVRQASNSVTHEQQLKLAVQDTLDGLVDAIRNKTTDRIKKAFQSKKAMCRIQDAVSHEEYKRIIDSIIDGK